MGGASTYSRRSPSARYRELVELHAALHEDGTPKEGLSPEATFSGASLFEQLIHVRNLARRTDAKTILDYGSGKGLGYGPIRIRTSAEGRHDPEEWASVQTFWEVDQITCYDPGYSPHSELPQRTFDGVVCTDVLEHCPQEDIPWIVEEIFGFAERFVCCTIACHPAVRTLPNGGNAHSTIQSPEWWTEILLSAAARRPDVLWEAWLRVELPNPGEQRSTEERIANFDHAADVFRADRLEVSAPPDGGVRPAWRRVYDTSESGPGDATARRKGPVERAYRFFREFGATYALRRFVNTVAFLCNPVYEKISFPWIWAYSRWVAEPTLRTLLEGRRVLVLGSGPSSEAVKSIPDDVVVATCNLGPKFLVDRGLPRRVDLYYYSNVRADRPGFERRLHTAAVLREVEVDLLVCEDLLTLVDVVPLRDRYARRILDFQGNQHLLRRLVRPARIRELRGSSFCPWTSAGVRLVQMAAYCGASEILLAGIDLGRAGYFWGSRGGRWHHDDIDGNTLEVLSRKHHGIYSISAESAAAEYFPFKELEAEGG